MARREAGHRPRWSLRVWLLASHLAVGACAVAALLLTGVLDGDLRWQTATSLHAQAETIALQLADEVALHGVSLPDAATAAQPRLAALRERTLVGIQVVDTDARVIASASAGRDVSLRDAPEVVAALSGSVGQFERPRDPVWQRREVDLRGPSRFADVRLFVAVPIEVDGRVVGAVVVSRTPRAQVQALLGMGSPLLVRVAAIGAFAVLVALLAGQWGSRSLRRLASAASSIASGADRPDELRRVQASRLVEARRLADAIDRMARRLRARTDGAEAFAGNAAHELRTPIATLRGTLELMRDDADMPVEQRDRFLDNGIAELQRLDAVVGGLLALGRASRLATDEQVDLDAIVRRVVKARDVAVSGRAARVQGNSAALEAVVGNLVDNALHHGGATVHVRGFQDDAHTGFDVTDDGPGIDEDAQARLFERFFTTDRERGVGLGLAVVRGIVEGHGGTVAVASQPGCTRFSVRLPRAGSTP